MFFRTLEEFLKKEFVNADIVPAREPGKFKEDFLVRDVSSRVGVRGIVKFVTSFYWGKGFSSTGQYGIIHRFSNEEVYYDVSIRPVRKCFAVQVYRHVDGEL